MLRPPNVADATTVFDVLRWWASQQPERPFITYLNDGERPGPTLTYGAFEQQVRMVASALIAEGAQPGDRALLLYPPGTEFVVALLGCLASGVVAVPAYPPRNARHMPRIEAILVDADARFILSVSDAHERIATWLATRPAVSAAVLCTDAIDPKAAAPGWVPPAQREAAAFLQYTSGSTGRPKGVVVSHANLLANLRMIRETFGFDESANLVSWLPPYHDMGLMGNLLEPIYLGCRVTLMSPAAFLQKPVRWLQAITTYRARTTGAPNFAFDLTARTVTAEQKAGLDLSSLEIVYNGSEPIDSRALDRFVEAFSPCGLRRAALYPCYGLAEATLLAAGGKRLHAPRLLTVSAEPLTRGEVRITSDGPEARTRVLVGCGSSPAGQDLVIADPETRQRAAADRVGEIWLRGPHVANGYWRQPDLTREAFAATLSDGDGPYLRTGDLGFVHDGDLYVTGRLKDVIIVRGRKFHPHDLERIASECHPSLVVGGAAAFAETGDDTRVVIVQEVDRAALRDLDAAAVIAAIRSAVADEFGLALAAIALVKPLTIPKTSSGKIQRHVCRDRWQAGEIEAVASWSKADHDQAPRPAALPMVDRMSVVEWLRRAVADETGRHADQIDGRATFSSHGLDSVTLVRLSGALAAWLGQELPPTLFYDWPTIDRLAQHLAGDQSAGEPRTPPSVGGAIAIVGIGCRLPGGVRGPDDFWRLLIGGVDAVTDVPVGRWPADTQARFGGFLDDIDRFDPRFFGISPREAAAMDPQHRLLLEVAWEALEHAGIPAERLAGTATGVFVGISTHDYERLAQGADEPVTLYSGVGNAPSAASGRLSYVLGVHGPCLSIDTACSSSLVATHLAMRSLRAGECDAALVGGVNALLAPAVTHAFARSGMMAADGRCKAFDDTADGYVRAEGCAVIVAKRLEDALASGDRVIAVLRGSAINQDGRSNGLTAPNAIAQQQVLRAAVRDAGVAPDEIDYVEAHGTGTSLGDPMEVGALAAVLGAGRTCPLIIGSAKTNLGHLEAAAGLVGLIKAALAIERSAIPPSLHFTRPNAHIPWASLAVTVATAPTPFPVANRPRRAGVSSFGFTGTNAHVVLEQAPAAPCLEPWPDRPFELLTLSAKDDADLLALSGRVGDALAAMGDVPLGEICHTANAGRSHFDHRLAVVAATHDGMREALARAHRSVADPASPPRLAWLFTGQGSQYFGMGRQLYETEPVYRAAFERCDEVVRRMRGESLRGLDAAAIDRTEWTQPALFTVEWALAELWRSWGLRPAAVLGHSIGELVAAAVAGVFTVEDGVRLACERGRLMQSLPPGGAMLAVFAAEAAVQDAFADEPLVGIGAVNANDEVVLSGDRGALERIAERLHLRGVATRRLTVSHAFHSPLVAPIADALERVVSGIAMAAPSLPIISNLTGRVAGAEIATAEYWRRHVTMPVRFAESVRTLASLAPTHVAEIGPAPVLSSLAARTWLASGVQWLPSMRRGRPDAQQMRESLAALYAAGAPIDWNAVRGERRGRVVTLPSYPFKRERCWLSLSAPGPAPTMPPGHPELGARLPEVAAAPGVIVWQLDSSRMLGPTWQGYALDGVSSPSFAVYLSLARGALAEALGPDAQVTGVEWHDVHEVVSHRITSLQTMVTPFGASSAECRLFVQVPERQGWTLVARAAGSSRAAPAAAPRQALDFGIMFFNGSEEPAGRDHYRLVLEAARFADRHGFSSVWAPERHYTAFGGLYPNPSVLHAALARETQHVRLMAGSHVVPLHHPLRAAEDWALVDNLSNGRVGVSLASGWNPDDFAIAPERYATRREDVFEQLEILRRLWRGEPLQALSGNGQQIQVRTYPPPVQPEFPAWITAAGNRQTFERAGASGAHLLTHLLDQEVETLTASIAAYRHARAAAGHDPATGRVSVMLHTFLGEDLAAVHDLVREPYCEYIKKNVSLLKGLAFSRGGDIDIAALSLHDLDEFVGFLYERFFTRRSLIGTPEACARLAEHLHDGGVDEIACLIDFAPDTNAVLRSLPHLDRLRSMMEARHRPVAMAAAPPRVEIDALRAQCGQALPARAFYDRLQSRGVAFDSGLRIVRAFHRRDGEALAEVDGARADAPVALEAAWHALLAALPAGSFISTAQGVYVPWSADGFTILDRTSDIRFVHAVLTGEDHGRDDTTAAAITLLSADGSTVARLDRLVTRKMAPAAVVAAPAAREEGVYEIAWEPLPDAATVDAVTGRWLLLADASGVGGELAQAFEQRGAAVVCLSEADVDPTDPADVRRMIDRAVAAGPLSGVVNLWPLDVGGPDLLSEEAIARGETLGVAATLHLAQALIAVPDAGRLWVVTRQAQAVESDEGAPAIAQSPAWGLGRVIAVDHPEIWGGLIDLGPQARHGADAGMILRELMADDGETQVAIRAERRLSARLVHSAAPPETEASFDANATYLITGGVGGIGRRIARWMIEHGATDLVLTARHRLPPEDEWSHLPNDVDARTRERVAGVQELRSRGATITVLAADASSRTDTSAVFDTISRRGRPLRGIFHLAGLAENQPLADVRLARDRVIMQPKIRGAWLLHELSRDIPLEFFVAFSSISAVWGSRGQSLYAAANHFLDALAALRRARGQPAVTVSWGPWANSGMMDSAGLQLLGRMGIAALQPAAAMDVLARLIAAGATHRVVTQVNWATFKDLFNARATQRLFARLELPESGGTMAATDLRRRLEALEADERRQQLTLLVGREVADVLGWSSCEAIELRKGFFDMGMDSLTGLELKNRLQTLLAEPLRATAIFNHSNVLSLAHHLDALIAPQASTPESDLDHLTEDELATLLDEQIGAVDAAIE